MKILGLALSELTSTEIKNHLDLHSNTKWEYKIKNVSVNWSMILRLEKSPEFTILCWKILGLALSKLTQQTSRKIP